MKQKPNRLTRSSSNQTARKAVSGYRRNTYKTSRYTQSNERTEVELEDNSSVSVKYIGVAGGLINPIIKGLEFKKRILSLPAYRSAEIMVSTTENLPTMHFSRSEYKNAWKVALVNFEKVKLK